MITREEYLKAKAIVDEYEQQEWDSEEELEWEEPEGYCENCGGYYGRHDLSCAYRKEI